MEDRITSEKLEKYFGITKTALNKVKLKIINGKESEAKEIIDMVENYLKDARFFEQKGDLINAFAAVNYSHGWLDCGVRLEIFNVSDDQLFTIK